MILRQLAEGPATPSAYRNSRELSGGIQTSPALFGISWFPSPVSSAGSHIPIDARFGFSDSICAIPR